MDKKYTLSYPDSMKILNEACKKDAAIRKIADEMFHSNMDESIKAVNECLIENAKRLNASLYDLCFHTIPEIAPADIDYNNFKNTGELNWQFSVQLKPVELDLTHDGGYWKNKYFRLKEKMQGLIDQHGEDD